MGSKLNKSQVDAICKRVYRRYPLVKGVRPRVKPEPRNESRFVLQFKTKVSASDGASLPITVRAVADSSGKIIKLTSSR